MKPLNCIVFICLCLNVASLSQTLPLHNKTIHTVKGDWLVDPIDAQACLYRTSEGQLVLTNGLVSRFFTVKPNGATIGLSHEQTNESFLRSVRPEAEVQIDGLLFSVGGLLGQPIHNYLLPEWLDQMTANPAAFKLQDYRVEAIKERFSWKKRLDWMPKDMPWPAPGKEVVFQYVINQASLNAVAERSSLDMKSLVYLKKVTVEVHYELYDNLPVFCKWIVVHNASQQSITVNTFKSEILAITEPESVVDPVKNWVLPNITVETDYNFGGMSSENIFRSSIAWNEDPLYQTQVNYERKTRCLLEVFPKYGPEQTIKTDGNFRSFRVWELLHDSWDRERKGLAHRRMMRALTPWVTENPILMHVRSAKTDAVKRAIDQCAEVGFEMVIMTFGSGFNAEDARATNLKRLTELVDYAHAKQVALGGYSLLASRRVGGGHDVVMPEGQTPRFGNSPCLGSHWGHQYFQKLYNLYKKTDLDIFEHDGSYPGDICISQSHPGHKGREDSQWNQYQRITDFYQWCRGQGIYLNVPDYYFLAGSNKTGMGYRETNWSLPRAQQEIIERQNVYDGTWHKTPSMGWMFVPLVQYHGGGAAATIEPLKDHLAHYEQRLANLFGAGVQACYRGPQLFDAPKTKSLVAKWVSFYKQHRRILDGDIIHIRRPDGCDYDAILHVDPTHSIKGMFVVYNPLNTKINRRIKVNLYYTGLKDLAIIAQEGGPEQTLPFDRAYDTWFDVEIPAKSQTWFTIR